MSQRNDSGVMAWAAAVSAVAMIAHLNGGKAIRDALYLSNYHVSWLPWMMIVTALVTMLVTLAASSAMRRFGPARVVPAAYLASAGLHLVECGLLGSPNRGAAAVVLYLHISAAPVFISGFMTSEGLFWAKMSAASTLAIAPVILAGWLAQRSLVRGLTFGAVK